MAHDEWDSVRHDCCYLEDSGKGFLSSLGSIVKEQSENTIE
jgi:hypothetical protein